MKPLVLAIFLAHFVTLPLLAQKSPIKYGDIPMEDLKMTAYPMDSSASAVILADYGEAYISFTATSLALNFERHVRIKILKKEGLAWADVMIQLMFSGSSEERVSGLKAASYNLENGKIVETKMSKEGVFKEKFNSYLNLQKFTIPNVKEGTVIEYSYKVVSDFLYNFPNWQFQYNIPVRHSEYWAVLPDFFIFEKYMQGYLSSEYEIKDKQLGSYQSKAHHWINKNVPAFKEEPFMTTENDYVSKINFALSHFSFPGQPVQEIMGSWAKLNATLLDSEGFGRAITGSNFLKKTVDEITAGVSDPMEKIRIIHTYVKKNLEWNGVKDFSADPLKKVFELKKGTCGDINIAVASMLEKAGIPVDMLLISTRDHGFVRKQYPMSKQFNYAVCLARVDGKAIILDATEKYLAINALPERCLNGEGLVISKNFHGWMPLQTKTKSKTVVVADLILNDQGLLKGKLNYLHDGYDAIKMRQDYFSKGEESYVKQFVSTKDWEIQKSEFKDLSVLDQSVKENYELNIPEHATVAGDVIYVNPFVTSQLQVNPFKQDTRLYPVDFGPAIEKVYMCKIMLPEGYVIDEMPQSKVLALAGNAAKYSFSVSVIGNTINVTSNMQINKNLFLQDEYPNLREFYSQVVAKQTEQIVLKKKQ